MIGVQRTDSDRLSALTLLNLDEMNYSYPRAQRDFIVSPYDPLESETIGKWTGSCRDSL